MKNPVCPFKKRTRFYDANDELLDVNTALHPAITEEDFQPCDEERCPAYRHYIYPHCLLCMKEE